MKKAKKTTDKGLAESSADLAMSLIIAPDDGLTIPAMFRIPQEERDQAWRDNPPKATPLFTAPREERVEDESTKAFRAQLEAQQHAKAAKRAPTSAGDTSDAAPRTPRPSRDGLMTVAELAKEYDLIPRLARAALRAAKIAKPQVGWAFPPGSELEKVIRAVLVKAKDAPTKEARPRGEPRTKKSKAPAIPPPSETTWSGSSKDRRKWAKRHGKTAPLNSSSDEPSVSKSSRASSASSTKPSAASKKPANASRTKSTKSSSRSKKSSSKAGRASKRR